MVSLGKLPGGADVSVPGGGRSISGDGGVVVGYSGSENAQNEAFRWTAETGMVGLGALEPFYSSFAGAVSGDGSTVVGSADTSSTTQAFRWTAQLGMQRLLGMVAHPSSASALSWDGSVIVGAQTIGNIREAFRWTSDSGPVGLGFLRPTDFVSDASDVTPDGSVIIGISSGPDATRSFRWTEANGMTEVGGPGISARSVSADGSVIVGITDQLQGFVWTAETGVFDLQTFLSSHGFDLSAWHQMQARSISANGTTVAGFGIGPRGREAWVATIPEPTSVILVGMAMIITFLRLVSARLRAP
jgi:probable HAF family extracellular repeat protein